MKKFTRILVLALALALTLTALVACDKSGNIKKDFEEAGYEVEIISAKNDKAKAIFTLIGYTEEDIDEIEEYELIYCHDGLKSALIVKYPSAAELKDELIDEGSKAYYDEQVEAGKVNGNCLLIYGIGGAADIFAGK
jgi:hypothetical protein